MNRKAVLWLVLLVGVLLLYRACDKGGGDVRFRLAFTVSVDGVEKTGHYGDSAVQHCHRNARPRRQFGQSRLFGAALGTHDLLV
ncbi:hypothetical protein JQ604_11450 [Bradyrhizobium jicamae]|uniref:hypothetical protein n=1 Tax=Bradyrhizobium jicamae TaxID=280332 RepID=UPI001BAD930C|nr:hypothetical protein [Bradyrhizobium jicamae]MBR0752800.1 hypothetical protein [Bradyrhizobium jicamae]